MVVFVCSSCGGSFKKNQVEKHWHTKCRKVHRVSCMDCGKDFNGKEYADHVKCITEDEKYGGNQAVIKEKKGAVRQEAWVAYIKEKVASAHDMDPKLKELLAFITDFPNLPSKKQKFTNFFNNCPKLRTMKCLDEAWEFLQAARAAKWNNKEKSNDAAEGSEVKPADKPSQDTVPDKGDSQNSKLGKQEKKNKRKRTKKAKKDGLVENTTEVSTPSKRKIENGESGAEGKRTRKERMKSKQEQVQGVCAEKGDEMSKKKRKISVQEDKDGSVVTSESNMENINGVDHNTPNKVAQIPGKPEGGKNKKKKKKPANENEN
ncbi:cell growth-regulating nucleolar protein [Panulirus ornatus]|uniref:cell growth-regulating nucleolar protein n=1 Tax=Panulirus ornatus TaxID=150431 RepID=UPI003A87CBEC